MFKIENWVYKQKGLINGDFIEKNIRMEEAKISLKNTEFEVEVYSKKTVRLSLFCLLYKLYFYMKMPEADSPPKIRQTTECQVAKS